MDFIQRGLRAFVLVSMVVLATVTMAGAQIVAFDAGPSGLAWRSLVSFDHGILTVGTPDGLVFSREFKGASGISFNPIGQPNYQPPDGTYIWQVTLGQPSKVDSRLRAAAAATRGGDGDPDLEALHRAASARATLIQSGAFQILNGAIVPSNLVEPGARSRGAGPRSMTTDAFRKAEWFHDDPSIGLVDQVIPDDLIVQGSACIGLDCVNNESFGFDTIRLKENNTRIKFDDTSTATGFPNHDWQLTANDSASGGANKFSIEDITAATVPFTVSGSAPTNSIFVDSTGRVGLRTSTPVLDVHIATGNTPAHRLEQNSSGGFTAQTWDIAGNEANFFVRDVTGGSRLPFRIRPGAPTSSIDINASGNVGIGTASPTGRLTVNTGSDSTIVLGQDASFTNYNVLSLNGSLADAGFTGLASGASGDSGIYIQSAGAGTKIVLRTNGLNERMRIDSAGNVGIGTTSPATQFHTTGGVRHAGVANCSSGIQSNASGDFSCLASSRQFKNVAGELEPQVALANVMALRPQIGSYKNTPDVPEHWLIAEETAAVDPALVGLANGRPFTVKTQNVVADLIAVVQQQQRRIEEQQRFIEEQQRRLEALERAVR
jgi:hypothetical protein